MGQVEQGIFFFFSKFLSWYQKCASALCTFKKSTNFGKENEKKKTYQTFLAPIIFLLIPGVCYGQKQKSGFGLDISLLLASFLKTLLLLLGGRLFIIISHFFICSLLLTFFRTLNLFFETVKYDFGKKSDIFKKLLFLGSHQIYIFTRFSIYFLLFHPCMVYYILKTVPFITC